MSEINLNVQTYIRELKEKWKLLVAIIILTLGLSSAMTLATPTLYEATARVAVMPVSASGTYVDLAVLLPPVAQLAIFQSSDVVSQTLQILAKTDGWEQTENVSSLANKVRVVNNSQDRAVFSVIARAETPHKAAIIANVWAKQGAQEVIRRSLENLRARKEQELQLVRVRLVQAEDMLVQFVQDNRLTWEQIETLETRLVPLSRGDLSGLSDAQSVELEKLLWERKILETVYIDLTTQVVKTQIAEQGTESGIYLLNAGEPHEPVQPRPVLNFVIALMVGVTLGILLLFGKDQMGRLV